MGRRVLFIAPRFFGYEREIAVELERRGATVDWLPDRPFDTPLMKAITKLRPSWIHPPANRLYERLLTGFGVTSYDIVFVLNGQTLSARMLGKLRASFPKARFVLYMWDSIANRAHLGKHLSHFDRACTFDPRDAARYGMQLRPLFFGRGFEGIPATVQPRYHISFVGTAHTDRFETVNRVRKALPTEINGFWYLYLQAPWVFTYYRLTNASMRDARVEDFHFDPLPKPELHKVFTESLAILDIEHPRQVGLTMRTFEALGAGKKLVTTNSGANAYDFYSADNVCVIDRANPIIPRRFLETPFLDLPEPVRRRYSISGWLEEVLDGIHQVVPGT